jgi:hypothetical protein
MPIPVRPMSLEDALDLIAKQFPDRLRDAIWRVVRSVPPPQSDIPNSNIARYPAALRTVVAAPRLEKLDHLRWLNRSGSDLFAAALVARIEERTEEFERLSGHLAESPPAMSRAMEKMLGAGAPEFLGALQDDQVAKQLRRLESEVGLNISEYVREFADAGAFLEWCPPDSGSAMTVYPTSCVVVQDAETLVSMVTATALVSCEDFSTLARAVDPQCWACSSDVVTRTSYVHGCYDLRSQKPPTPGAGLKRGKSRFLAEDVTVRWGLDATRMGGFHNVLRIDNFKVDRKRQRIDVDFSLARSIDSRILWDGRPGGILFDHGFIKVRPMLAPDRWRVTTRKVLLFSDRSPNVAATGSIDFGQMLNYLAPAALSWWLESELSSSGDSIYSDPERVLERVQSQSSGGADD